MCLTTKPESISKTVKSFGNEDTTMLENCYMNEKFDTEPISDQRLPVKEGTLIIDPRAGWPKVKY